MAYFATPYGLRYAAHCINRAHAQNNRPALIPAGGKLGVTSAALEEQGFHVAQGQREAKKHLDHEADHLRRQVEITE